MYSRAPLRIWVTSVSVAMRGNVAQATMDYKVLRQAPARRPLNSILIWLSSSVRLAPKGGPNELMSVSTPTQSAGRLDREAVGLVPTLFQSITHMAPAAAVAFSIIVGVPYAGGSIPLAVLLALIACLFVASSISQLARHLPSAGGLYSYNAHGLGPVVGFLVAWAFMLSEPIVAPLLYLIFGNVIASTMSTYWHTPSWVWAPFVVLAGLIVWFLTYTG